MRKAWWVIIVIMLLMLFLALSSMRRSYASCGQGSYYTGGGCDANCQIINPHPEVKNCFSDGEKCVMQANWIGCYWQWDDKNKNYNCKEERRSIVTECADLTGPTPGGGCAPAPQDLAVEGDFYHPGENDILSAKDKFSTARLASEFFCQFAGAGGSIAQIACGIHRFSYFSLR